MHAVDAESLTAVRDDVLRRPAEDATQIGPFAYLEIAVHGPGPLSVTIKAEGVAQFLHDHAAAQPTPPPDDPC